MANESKSSLPANPESTGSVEMPRPTAWPIALAFGIALTGLGAATSLAFCIVGIVVFVIALVGWISQLLPGRGHEHEELAGPAAKAIRARTGAVGQLKPGVVGYRFQLPEKVHPISAGVKGGMLGGLLMPIPAIAWGIASGHGVWFPINLLVGTIVPVSDMPREELVKWLGEFHLWAVLVGIAIHAAMSIGFGLVGGVLLPTLPPIPGGPLLFGGLILPLAWTGASYGLMGVANPPFDQFVDWRWYIVSQFVYGIATSLVILRSEEIPIAPRGKGDGAPPAAALVILAASTLLFSGCSDALPGKPNPDDKFRMPHTVLDFSVLYTQHCAGCHGEEGKLGAGPPLNDPLFLALANDQYLQTVIAAGRKGTLMPAWSTADGGPLTSEQVAALVQGLKTQWGKAEQEYRGAPTLDAEASKPAGNAAAGAAVFRVACAGCHGSDGRGGEIAGKLNEPAYLGLASDQLLRRYVITGRPDLDMPDYKDATQRGSAFRPLTNEQVGDLVALMTSWRSRSADHSQINHQETVSKENDAD